MAQGLASFDPLRGETGACLGADDPGPRLLKGDDALLPVRLDPVLVGPDLYAKRLGTMATTPPRPS
jgi:hypothetical protein